VHSEKEREYVWVCVRARARACVRERKRQRDCYAKPNSTAPASCLKMIQRRGNAWPAERPSPLCFGRLPEDSLCFQGTTLQYHPFLPRLLTYLNKQCSQYAQLRPKNPLVSDYVRRAYLPSTSVSLEKQKRKPHRHGVINLSLALHKRISHSTWTWKDGNLSTRKFSLVHITQLRVLTSRNLSLL